MTLPSVGSSSRSTNLPTVDLPEPDSPARPNTSPLRISNVTPSTARTYCRLARVKPARNPCETGNHFLRSTTSTRFSTTCGPLGYIFIEPACGFLARDHLAEHRHFDCADLHRLRAPRMERAPGRRIQQIGRRAPHLVETVLIQVDIGHGLEQAI